MFLKEDTVLNLVWLCGLVREGDPLAVHLSLALAIKGKDDPFALFRLASV